MVRHTGIVACSAEGAALCYLTICREGADILGRHTHPEITMHTYPLTMPFLLIALGVAFASIFGRMQLMVFGETSGQRLPRGPALRAAAGYQPRRT